MNISNIVWKRNHCTHNEFVQLKLAFLSYPRYREEMDDGKEGREPEETYREVRASLAFDHDSTVVYYFSRGENTRIMRSTKYCNAAEKPLFAGTMRDTNSNVEKRVL